MCVYLRSESAHEVGVKLLGAVALCPLVATDSAGVPLDAGLAKDFAKMLTDVTPELLQTQWSGLVPVRQMLTDDNNKVHSERKMPLLIMTGDEDPLFSPAYYTNHLDAPLKEARVRAKFDSTWVRLPYGDHALCRYRRTVVKRVVKFALKCAGQDVPIDVFRIGRELLSWQGLFDTVPMALITVIVAGFVGGRFCATPEGQQAYLEQKQEMDRNRMDATRSPKFI